MRKVWVVLYFLFAIAVNITSVAVNLAAGAMGWVLIGSICIGLLVSLLLLILVFDE